MRTIDVGQVREAVAELCQKANFELPEDFVTALRQAREKEVSAQGKRVLALLDENQQAARTVQMATCQDTGFVLIFANVGQDVHLVGGDLVEAINAGVAKGYKAGYLRPSIVKDPLFNRENTGDNSPAVIHTKIVPGDHLTLQVLVKGAGSENCTKLAMLTPGQGLPALKAFVVETVKAAGPNACPPMVVCVGVGGTADRALQLAKEASLRHVGEPHTDPQVAALEQELLELVNATGIGPQGYGGRTTALACHIERAPTHIASLPVAVNLQCHAVRHQEVVL
ncbi:MAG TPA: fumarate hydratase [Chloroflexia bacterium]|nr:fumarate hydratase [Chloroflexia bacterium]